jgi:murein DD-endopeptidase MepM/ murein hydrolase activator NlpD
LLVLVILASLLLPSLALAAPSKSAKKSLLQKKRATLHARITQVKQRLRLVQKKEYVKRTQLRGVEHRLRVARGQVQYATLRVTRAKHQLHIWTNQLSNAKEEFADTRKDVGQRLVALDERGDQGYLELLASSASFDDLLQRSEFAELLMEQDREALVDLKEHRDKVAAYQQTVAQKTAELKSWQAQARRLHDRTSAERTEVAGELSDVRAQREQIEAELAALERESNAIARMLRAMLATPAGRARYNRHYSGGMGGLPVRGRITSGFGYRFHPILHRAKLHTGIDIAAPSGTPIVSTAGGEVVTAGWRGGYGNTVIIDHGRGRATLYGHMSSVSVRVGQVVSRGQLIGRVGSTGLSTGPHCHYELRVNGSPVNPR